MSSVHLSSIALTLLAAGAAGQDATKPTATKPTATKPTATKPTATKPTATLQLVTAVDRVVPGRTLTVGLHIRHSKGAHTYWKHAGTVGLPTSIKWKLPKGCTAGPIQWSLPMCTKMGVYTVWGYEQDALLLTDITVPKAFVGSFALTAEVAYMVCARTCNPGHETLKLSLPVGDAARPDAVRRSRKWGPRFARVRREQPRGPAGVWTVTAHALGADQVVLELAPQAGANPAVLTGKAAVRFFGHDRCISSDGAPTVRHESGRVVMTLPREKYTPKATRRLRGMLHCAIGFGKKRRFVTMRVDVPIAAQRDR